MVNHFAVKNMSELFTPYVCCQIFGAIILIAAALAQQWDKNKSSERQREAVSKANEELRQGLAKRDVELAQLVFARASIDQIRERMLNSSASTTSANTATVQSLNLDLVKVDERIANALREIPQEIRDSYGKEKMAEGEEALAQARANAVNSEIRPRVIAALAAIRDVVVRASAKGVIDLDKIEDREPTPTSLMFTRFAFLKSKLPEENPSKGFKVHFKQGRNWQVFIKYGFVKSPELLARWFDSPTDIYYPMVRISIDGLDMATVYFHHETKALRLEYAGDRGYRDKLVALQDSGKDEDVVAAFAIELMKLSRLSGQ